MSRVGIADLKARLSHHLRKVRAGKTVVVLDRGQPIAQIVPCERGGELEVIRAARRPVDMRLPAAPATPTDSLALLLRDRSSR